VANKYTMLTNTLIKEKLHQFIEVANEEKIKAIYTLLESEITSNYSDTDLQEFHNRRTKHLNGETTSYSVEDSINKARLQQL